MKKVISLSPQESILYFYIKQHGWTTQKDLIYHRGKDRKTTMVILQNMAIKGILKSKFAKVQTEKSGKQTAKWYNINKS